MTCVICLLQWIGWGVGWALGMTCVICLLQWMGVGLGIGNDLCYMPSAVDGGWAGHRE